MPSPEIHLGRGHRGRPEPPEGAVYEFPQRLRLNEWALAGEWAIGDERVTLEGERGSIAVRCHARDVHLVIAPGLSGPIPFRVLIGGAAPGSSHGEDADEDGSGSVRDARLFQLVREREAVRERTVEIEFLQPGVEAYVFTFG